MKLYVYDRGVYGMSVVIANSADDALSAFKSNQVRDYNHMKVTDIDEFEIREGMCIDNLGDA